MRCVYGGIVKAATNVGQDLIAMLIPFKKHYTEENTISAVRQASWGFFAPSKCPPRVLNRDSVNKYCSRIGQTGESLQTNSIKKGLILYGQMIRWILDHIGPTALLQEHINLL